VGKKKGRRGNKVNAFPRRNKKRDEPLGTGKKKEKALGKNKWGTVQPDKKQRERGGYVQGARRSGKTPRTTKGERKEKLQGEQKPN